MIYFAIASLDGFVNDADGKFEWAAPDEQVHAIVNDLEREVGTYILGRRMYETMAVWETWDTAEEPAVIADFAAIWRTADKIVYSRTLDGVSTARTKLEREFDPAALRELEAAAERPISIGGSELAGQALAAGLVDDLRLILAPVLVGAGTPALPSDLRLDLEQVDQRQFENGMVYLRYAVRAS